MLHNLVTKWHILVCYLAKTEQWDLKDKKFVYIQIDFFHLFKNVRK